MELYLYKARQVGTNKIVKSEGRFESKSHATKYLIDNKMVPIKVDKKTALTSDVADFALFRPKIKTKDIVFFCKQFGVMLGAGISIGGALNILGQQAENRTLQKIVQDIDKDVQKGSNLSDAMSKHSEFPGLLINMVRSGEATGNMDAVMEKMSIHFEKQMALKRTIKKAVTYPIMVLITIAIVIPILMIFVIPGFVEMFADTGVQLPLPTRIVMAVSDWMVAKWYIILGGTVGGVVGIILLNRTKQGKRFFDKMALTLPLVSNLNKKTITALFSDTLSLLVTSGVPVFQSLDIVRQVIQNTIAKEDMDTTLSHVREGNTISNSLLGSKIFPPMMISMLKIGEETGALDEMLTKTSEYYNTEVEVAVEQMTVMIEPILIVFIAVVVGGIMMAVMLPTFTMATEMM